MGRTLTSGARFAAPLVAAADIGRAASRVSRASTVRTSPLSLSAHTLDKASPGRFQLIIVYLWGWQDDSAD